jgi:hypothetical protein
VDELKPKQLSWARYHPHCQYPVDPSNTLYLATKRLTLPGYTTRKPGAGTFSKIRADRILTAAGQPHASCWRLPAGFYPQPDKPALSYHSNLSRWHRHSDHCILDSAFRGQEFVLGSQHYPESLAWVARLLDASVSN